MTSRAIGAALSPSFSLTNEHYGQRETRAGGGGEGDESSWCCAVQAAVTAA